MHFTNKTDNFHNHKIIVIRVRPKMVAMETLIIYPNYTF